MAKTIKVKLKSRDGKNEVIIFTRNGLIQKNKQGFCPVQGTWLEVMNPANLTKWYIIPEDLTL